MTTTLGIITIKVIGLTRAQWDAVLASLQAQANTFQTNNPTTTVTVNGAYREET